MTSEALHVRLSNGTTIAVPRSLRTITTYVALEQETWFEKELAFLPRLLQPGMTAIDVGANVGVYSLAMARLVAPGCVFAYEPASAPRALLEQGKALNNAPNLEISPLALSDSLRDGHIAFADSFELGALSNPGERISITHLDAEDAERDGAPDLVKIDAEGEEERILIGGRNFFSRHSPLVMFEIKAGNTINARLRSAFPAMGYRLFRLAPGLPALLPVSDADHLDDFELNLFAAKPDRIDALAQAGALIENVEQRKYPMFQLLSLEGESYSQLSAYAQLAIDAGERLAAIEILSLLFRKMRERRFVIPMSELAAIAERFERVKSFSSFYSGASPLLDWLSQQPSVSAEIVRRHVLTAARAQRRIPIPDRLCREAPDHLNAALWRASETFMS